MLISKVCEGGAGGESPSPGQSAAPEYRTASELFDLMTRDASFDEDNSLSAQDLVLLYQNMDLGTRLMNDANELAVRKPNQYVETVVYNDQDQASDSDSEMYTDAEIHDVFTCNQERLDFIDNTSLENILCHKFGGVAMHTSDIDFDYDKKFFFQDPYIKNQLHNFNLANPSDTDDLFSPSLIDYICCKRLEDNYNFYMDNIIRYVQHKIDQLKRISNGDYLTDRAKEKWREVISSDVGQEKDAGTKVLATSTSIPLRVECKAAGKATWDELVRSEVDVRSLSKILEKKIIVEIPKLLCGSFRLYSKRCADNLVISCKKEEQKNSEDSRVDVVLKLERAQTGDVISNISSIMILKTVPALPDLRCQEILPLHSTDQREDELKTEIKEQKATTVTVIEVIKNPIPVIPEHENEDAADEDVTPDVDENEGSYAGTNDYPISDRNASCASIQCSSGSSIVAKDTEKPVFPTDKNRTQQQLQHEYICNIISPQELQMTMRKLNMRNSTLEESAEDTTSQSTSKKRSPMRVRIKSPYENKSFSLEEKKRKRLLEIRERREKRKLALSESCKITKHKYAKGAVTPQASSSVTKLSITNRSFYNSIYGQNIPVESKLRPRKPRNTPDVSRMDETNEDCYESPMVSPNKNSKKYVNRSYYLDEAETEVTYMQRMKSKDIQSPHSTTNSVVSTEFSEQLELFKQLIIPSETNLTSDVVFLNESKFHTSADSEGKLLMPIAEYENKAITVMQQSNEKPSSDECRKSIDQLYDLMKQLGKQITSTEGDKTSSKITESNNLGATGSIHGSESGSSVKHSPRANNIASAKLRPNKPQTPVPPKSAMASKQSPKADADKGKKERKRVVISPIKGSFPENPLKAISQLLHEFENVQKKPKSPDGRQPKKPDVMTADSKSYSRPGNYRRRSRLDQHTDNEQERKSPHGHNINPRDKRTRPVPESARGAYSHIDDRNFDRVPKKKIADIIDEAKEARGEAVRGPSKFPSRLESLAQPKKSYVQAHVEEYQTRYGRNMILAERLQRLVTHSAAADRASPVTKNRCKKAGPELATSVKQRAPSVPLIEQHKARTPRLRRSASSSPASPARRTPAASPRHSPRRKRSPNLDKPPNMGKKMVSVESYLNSHFREERRGLRCRVPFVPHDIEIASLRLSAGADESPSLGTTLHHMFDTVVGGGLAALAECSESRAPSEAPRSDSDYCVNILEDRYITTAVGLCTESNSESFHPHHNSTTEMEKLESALYTHISGSFQKRLRIKNLTLTPKTSMQQVFLLQSGDAGSVLVKSVSNVKLDRRSAKSLHELKPMPVLSNTHVDWRFTQIPMHVATVGYAFTQKQSRSASGSRVQLTEPPIAETREHSVQQTSQFSQCFRGDSPNPFKDASAQVDDAREVTTQAAIDESTNNCDTPDTKESMVNSVMHVNTTFFVDETSNEDKVNEMETDPKEEESEPSKECSSTVPAAPAPSFVTPEYTTSLDMLVGLLNEIQKITCQNQIASSDQTDKTELVPTRATTVSQLEPPRNIISLTSLDNLCRLESNASIFTYYMSNNETTTSSNNKLDSVIELKKALRFSDVSVESPKSVAKEHVAVEVRNPSGVDKEVSVNICNDSVDICTNVPSSVRTVMCSAHSVASLRAYHSCSSNTFRAPSIKKIIELPQIETTSQQVLIPRENKDLNDKCLTNFAPIRKIENVKIKKSLRPRSEIGKYCVGTFDLDPMFKFKRDILVSVYSILVLTVFAALSFPELLMFQS